MTIKNLVIDGGGQNIGIHAVWCRNVILENVRIYNAKKGVIYKGFVNTFKDLTIWNCKEGIDILGGNATLFERCFTSNCGWRINNVQGFSLVCCSSDDYNPCYEINNSSVSLVGCTCESKGLGFLIKESTVDISGGDFQTHIYDSTKELIYLKCSDNSIITANSCYFHLNNYLNKKVPQNSIFEVSNNSKVTINGRVEHSTGINLTLKEKSSLFFNGKYLSNGINK